MAQCQMQKYFQFLNILESISSSDWDEHYFRMIDLMKNELAIMKEDLMVEQQNSFAELRKEWTKTQENLIRAEIANARKIVKEVDCAEVEQCLVDDFTTLHKEINAIDEKPRQVKLYHLNICI